ncbi:hypothetical protein CAPTEDRAFT_225271 [Capitella teleta]|uniref:Carbonic anhydrase n=1 Tax=Capitella teleta TaxID=283909 RepID=R7U445_CAPTE|nr:hypothetical protein CAPTEDRAFT_225271 [Capitella teleta]|eukprot:ELT98446.1 hypothetical protein CAPTEDRAFT_225271 [Capitella teleta]
MGNFSFSSALCPMGNSHQSQRARRHADEYKGTWSRSNDYEWGYTRDTGPENWWVHYPSAGGRKQSPIDINPEVAEFDSDLVVAPLKLQYSRAREEKLMHNTGATCAVRILNSESYATGGPLGSHKYTLREFHFHWGDSNQCGSEHTVRGKAYSAELHLVHWNSDAYNTFEEAQEKDDGLLVVAIFIQCCNSSNQGLEYLVQFLTDIPYKGQATELSSEFDLNHLLPVDTSKYWVYEGSMTTPPCHESVTWLIFYDPLKITGDELSLFRTLNCYGVNEDRPILDEHYGRILKNYRPTQPLGSRVIRAAEPNFMTHKDFHQQFHSQALFTTFPEIKGQFNRQGIK